MLDEVDPQAVYIIMHPHQWHPLALDVLRQGRHLFTEQPPLVTTTQIRSLAYLAETHRCLTMVGFQRRHIPAMSELRRRVEAHGPIHTARVDFLKRNLDGYAEYQGIMDYLNSDGIHAVDCLRHLCGGDPVRVLSTVRPLFQPVPLTNSAMAIVEFSSGAVGQVHFSYGTGRRIFRAEIHGRGVTAYVDADRESYIVGEDGSEEPQVFRSSSFGEALGGLPVHWLGFWHAHRHFVDCLKEGRQPVSHFGDAVKTRELIDLIERTERAGTGP
jgi:virulence factor